MIFFTSDTHFSSIHAIIRENRPFKNFRAFDKHVIKLWNKQAGVDDIIYHLGDFVNYNDKENNSWQMALKLVKKIKAKVILVIGNNEERIIQNYFKNFDDFKNYCISLGFYDVLKNQHIKIADTNIYLTHYPKNHKQGYVNLFGHTHRATGLWKSYGLNVGCDLNHFKLYSEKDILKLLKHKEDYWDKDENVTM